jgi:hypothetical protein
LVRSDSLLHGNLPRQQSVGLLIALEYLSSFVWGHIWPVSILISCIANTGCYFRALWHVLHDILTLPEQFVCMFKDNLI